MEGAARACPLRRVVTARRSPAHATSFADRFPGVEVRLAPETTEDPYGALERSAVDVAIVYSAPPVAGAVVPRWILDAQGSLERLVVLPLGEDGLWRTWYAA